MKSTGRSLRLQLHASWPIIRTFAPFVAGRLHGLQAVNVLYQSPRHTLGWTFCGRPAISSGNIPVIKRNFSLVIMAIILVFVLRSIVEYVRQRKVRQPEEGRPAPVRSSRRQPRLYSGSVRRTRMAGRDWPLSPPACLLRAACFPVAVKQIDNHPDEQQPPNSYPGNPRQAESKIQAGDHPRMGTSGT